MDSLIFILGVSLMVISYIISIILERAETIEYKLYLITKTVSDGLMFFGMVIILFSYGMFLYENVK